MDEDLEKKEEEGKIDLLNPVETGTPPEAAGFSMQAQKDKFLGGGQEVPSISIEQKAMEKVGNIFENSWSHTTQSGKLSNVLGEGVVSQDFAERAKIQYDRENTSEDPEATWWKKDFKLYKLGKARQVNKDGGFEEIGLLINTPQSGTEDIDESYAIIPRRVAPREFIGLIIPDERVVLNGNELSQEASRNFAVSEAAKIAQSTFGADISLPIYGASGNLLWPEFKSRQEIEMGVIPKAA